MHPWWDKVLIVAAVLGPIIAYRMGRAQASIDYAKDEEGYIDQKNCADCKHHFDCNLTTDLSYGRLRNKYFAEQCVQNNKKNFEQKEKECPKKT
jgi:hypothetical protein